MFPVNTIRRYPRLSRVLLAIAEQTDPQYAAGVIEAAKRNRTSFAHEVVQEAWELRRLYRNAVVAERVVLSVVANEVPPLLPTPSPSSIPTSLF